LPFLDVTYGTSGPSPSPPFIVWANGGVGLITLNYLGMVSTAPQIPPAHLFKPNMRKGTGEFSVCHLNIRSIRKNFSEFISVLHTYKYWPDIIVLSETWIFTDETDLYPIKGYTSIFKCNNNNTYRSGGIVVYVKSHIKATETSCNFSTADVVKCQICLTQGNSITVLALYRRHSI